MPRLYLLLMLFVVLVPAQDEVPRQRFPEERPQDIKLPDGTSQRQAIVKADHKHSVEDAKKMAELASEVQSDLEKGDANIVSLKMLRQLDEIERLSKRIRGRLKRE